MRARCGRATIEAPRMEQAVAALRDIQIGLWVGLGIVAYAHWRARKRAPEAFMLATFVLLAAISIGGLIVPAEPTGRVGYRVLVRTLIVGIVFIPYLLFRFAGTFTDPPPWMRRAAGGLTAVVVALGVAVEPPVAGEPRTAPMVTFVLLLVAHWVGLSAYAATSMWRRGAGQSRIVRNRMRTLALGAAGLSVVLVLRAVAGRPVDEAGPFDLAAQVLTFLSAPLFLLGFAPPGVVAWWWRRADEGALRSAYREMLTSATPAQIADALLPHAVRTAGAWRGELRSTDGELLGSYEVPAGRRGNGSEVLDLGMTEGSLLIWTSPYAPYFGRENLAALGDLVSLTDIALSRARVLADQQQLAYDLAQANRAMNEFVAIASHDLRTPLAVVQGLSRTLDGNWDRFDDASKQEQVAAIVRQSDQLSRIVEDLLTVSRIDALEMKGDPRSVPLREATATIVHDLSIIDGSIEIDDELRAWVDPQHLARMLSNYIRNAATYGMPPVRIEAHARGERVELRVQDAGPGVPEASRDRLFEKFWRADKAKSRSASGTGLGLAIVRGLARASGGDAWYEHDRTGHRFAISLPLDGAHPGGADVERGAGPRRGRGRSGRSAARARDPVGGSPDQHRR